MNWVRYYTFLLKLLKFLCLSQLVWGSLYLIFYHFVGNLPTGVKKFSIYALEFQSRTLTFLCLIPEKIIKKMRIFKKTPEISTFQVAGVAGNNSYKQLNTKLILLITSKYSNCYFKYEKGSFPLIKLLLKTLARLKVSNLMSSFQNPSSMSKTAIWFLIRTNFFFATDTYHFHHFYEKKFLKNK